MFGTGEGTSVVSYPVVYPCCFRPSRVIRDKAVQPGRLFSANSAPSIPLRELLTMSCWHESSCLVEIVNSLVADDADQAETARMNSRGE